MALTTCPDCEGKVSTRAASCPHCGCPIGTVIQEETKEPTIERPFIAEDLEVGETFFWGTRLIDGEYDPHLCTDPRLKSPSGKLFIHEKGFRVTSLFIKIYDIHYSQVIDMKCVPNTDLYKEEGKSVILRAIGGGLILGGIGAVVGGMSGLNKKQLNMSSLIINYWDTETDTPQTLAVTTDSPHLAKAVIEKATKLKNELVVDA